MKINLNTKIEFIWSDYYSIRNFGHKEKVLSYAQYLVNNFEPHGNIYKNELLKAVQYHDDTKMEDEEYKPYLLYTIAKKYGYEIEPDLQKAFTQACKHHYMHNDHHPEFWQHVPNMPQVSMMHMCCDWAAMSDEFDTDLLEWVNENINKWEFTEFQKTFIYKAIEVLHTVLETKRSLRR